MILYLSGTGNTRQVTKRLSDRLGDTVYCVTSTSPDSLPTDDERLIIVSPVYSWGIAPYMLRYIENLPVSVSERLKRGKAWLVLTCGDETGFAPEMIKSSLAKIGICLNGGWSVIMPNNYVLLPGFGVDSKDIERKKLSEYGNIVDEIASKIKLEVAEEVYVRGSWPKFKSQCIYPLFKRWGIIRSKWHWTEECVGCSRCASICPVGNIDFSSGRPKWGDKCISCTACFHICPAHAVEYGRVTRQKKQYRTLIR